MGIITDRVNTTDIKSSLRFLAKQIQKIFPSADCCVNDGDHRKFIYNNINRMSAMSMTMADCHQFLHKNERLEGIVEKNNVLQRCHNKIMKHKRNGCVDEKYDYVGYQNGKRKKMLLYFDEQES